jgi:hypothetical protein
MPPKLATSLRACCAAVVLLLVGAQAAESKTPLGATRAQVIDRLGEPRRAITTRDREVLFYPRERIVLREGVVIEVEPLMEALPPPRRTPAPASTPGSSAEGATTPRTASTPSVAPRPGPAAAETATAPTRPAETSGSAPTAATSPSAGTTSSADAAASEAAPAEPAYSGAEPQLLIKSVRRPGSTPGASRADAVKPDPAAPNASADSNAATAATAPSTPPAVPSAAGSPAAARETTAGAPTASTAAPATAATVAPAAPSATVAPVASTEPTAAAEETAKTDAAVTDSVTASPVGPKATAEQIKDAKLKAARRRLADAASDSARPEEAFFSLGRTLFAFAVIAGGIGALWWRRRQRRLEMAATTVSRTPFEVAQSGGGARFTADILARLEWKRFEELVAAYYAKTGVVAVRTKAGPGNPVHIKISWKGEPRPFAYVQCLSHPSGLIGPDPLRSLVTALAAEDIRRGYVVSTGKFGVDARDLAEEKHLTLLPGDIFLEKLNALPDPARAELMQEILAGDPTTPSCPKCEAKMLRLPDQPGMARCPHHPDQVLPLRK